MSSKSQVEEKKNNKSASVVQKNDASMKPSTSQSATATPASTSDDHKPQEFCVAEGCKKKAVSHPEWDNEYCSVNCCYNHCKNTFKAWLASNKAAKMKTDVISEENTAGSSKQ